MDARLRNLYEELCDELRYVFKSILEHEGSDTVPIRYRGNDVYEGIRDTGKIIIGSEGGEDVSYAYRLRFNSKPNKPDQISWYSSNQGFSDLSILLGEKDFIVDDVLQLYSRRTSVLDEEDIQYIDKIFKEIQSRRQSIQREYDIYDVKQMIEERDKSTLQNIISPDRKSDVEIWKLIFSYDENQDVIQNSIDFPYIDDSIMLVRGKRMYCSGDKTKQYPLGLIIEDTDQLDKFFIHRIPRSEKLDDFSYDWGKDDLYEILGYDTDRTSSDDETIPSSTTTRITRNITVRKKDYKDELRSYHQELFSEVQRILHRLYYRFYRDSTSIDLDNFNARITPQKLDINDNCSTAEIKEIQSELGIDESDVRTQQQLRDIGRLSSNLRANIVKDLYMEAFSDWLFSRSYSQIKEFQYEYEEDSYRDISQMVPRRICGVKIGDELVDFVVQDPSEIDRRGIHNFVKHISRKEFSSSEGTTFYHNNVELYIPESRSHMYDVQMKGYDQSVINRVIVPEESRMIISNEGNQRGYKLDKGVYVFTELNTVRTIHYSSN